MEDYSIRKIGHGGVRRGKIKEARGREEEVEGGGWHERTDEARD